MGRGFCGLAEWHGCAAAGLAGEGLAGRGGVGRGDGMRRGGVGTDHRESASAISRHCLHPILEISQEWMLGQDERPFCLRCTVGRYEGFTQKVRKGSRTIRKRKIE